jgi:hypothetical protein
MAELKVGTLAEFRTWLKMRRDKRVGFPHRAACCPLANWLRSINIGQKVHVTYSYGKLVAGEVGNGYWVTFPPTMLPLWAADFAEYVDNSAEPGAMDGAYALNFLEIEAKRRRKNERVQNGD